MPGKLPGGKVRISQTAPVLLSNTKVSPSSEVKYFGLVRDQALDDLTSRPDALEQVLQDVQDPAEKEAEGSMNATDLSIIDGIVNFDVKYEDLEILEGASLKDGEGGALVNPRQRLTDRITQFESFAGRGTPFVGAGPVKFTYIVPKNGDLLDGSVAISAAGAVTGTGTTFADDLSVGDFVILCKADGITKNSLNASDQAVYKVTGLTSNTVMTVEPAPSSAISAGKKLRKRYCHNSPPPFYTEDISSTAFNAPDHLPNVDEIEKSHRQGYVLGGGFLPSKQNESWWEGAYNQELRERSEYGGVANNADLDPKFPIVKDSNISFEFSKDKLSQNINFGIRYDCWVKRGFESDRTFFKWLVQVNGRLKIDYFKKTSIDPTTGVASGSWVNAIDTSDPETFFTQVSKEDLATNVYGYRTFFLQGGPDYANSSNVDTTNSQDIQSTLYTDREGVSRRLFDDDYVPVVIRFWYGQDTIDNSISPIDPTLLSIQKSVPSFALDIVPTNLISGLLSKWNNYFGLVKLTYVEADGQWEIDGTTQPANYESNSAEFNQLFEVLGYDETTAIAAPGSKNYLTWRDTLAEFSNVPSDVLTGARVYDSGGSVFTTNRLEISFPVISSPSDGDVVYAMLQNRPRSVLPQTTDSDVYNRNGEDELWQRYLYNPDYLNNYVKASDLLEAGTNYIEPNPVRVPFENNAEYFRYKYGKLPTLGTFGPARYDGTIVNRITTANNQRDYDASHSKLLFIGRQKKDASIAPLASGEIRNNADNYTFIAVEQDQAGNGGEVTILARPVNSMAVLENQAGEDSGGKALHSADNTTTFSNANRQNITNIQMQYLPVEASYDNGSNTQSIRYETFLGQKILSYVLGYTGDPATTPTYDTSGVISSSALGYVSRDPLAKSIYIASFDRNKGTERFFYGLISAERRVETAQLTLETGGLLTSSTLFSNNDGDITSNNQPYIGATVEFYASTDTSYSTLLETKLVSAYDAGNERVTLNNITNLTVGTLYNIRVYYNYFVISSEIPASTTLSNGTNSTTSFPTLGGTEALQIRFIYNNSYQFSRTDSGSGLNFAETLYVATVASPNAVFPFGANTELPSPPSALVSPFGYDNGPTDPSNPGLGGICYPPYNATAIELQDTIKSDSQLYAETEGNFDVYFGSPQVSLTNLGLKYLQITDQLLFDFDSSQRASLISEAGTFPQFTAASYTHKLKVELNPDIPGLFTRGAYSGVTNDNIFKDVLKYSNNKPVKEIFFLFANKASGSGETAVSLLTANNPGWT